MFLKNFGAERVRAGGFRRERGSGASYAPTQLQTIWRLLKVGKSGIPDIWKLIEPEIRNCLKQENVPLNRETLRAAYIAAEVSFCLLFEILRQYLMDRGVDLTHADVAKFKHAFVKSVEDV